MSEPKNTKDLALDEAEVKVLKNRLVTEKVDLQGQLAALNAKCSTRLPTYEFKTLQSKRSDLVRMLMEKEGELSGLKEASVKIHAAQMIRKNEVLPSAVKRFIEIRDKWHGYSMDASNHQKARETAWKISQEIGEVMQVYFNRDH